MRYVTKHQRQRHQMIGDWRGLSDGPLLDLPAKKIDEVMVQVLKTWKLDERCREEDLATAWLELVGNFIGQYTAPDALNRGVLVVRVLQPALHHSLMMEKPRLLKRLQERFGKKELRDIRFRHG